MISPRRLVLLLWFLATGTLSAQAPSPSGTAPVFADERAARLAERYKAMLVANPTEGLAVERLWKSYEDAGTTAQLIEEYRRAYDGSPSDTAAALVYGFFLKKAGRMDEASAAFDRAANTDPASPLPMLARAGLALARSQPAEAAGYFEAALDHLPAADHRRADLLLKAGDAWLAANEPLKAAGDWEKTVTLAPDDLSMRRRLAENYEKNGLSDRAISHYEYVEAHADPAGRATAARELGRLHEARGEFEAARDALDRALVITARDNWMYGDLLTRLIRLYQRAGRIPELEARWQKAAEDAPRDLGGFFRLETLAEAQGDPVGERRWLEKIVSLSPRDRESTLKLARLLADNNERSEAARLYDKLLQSQPGNLDLILARADLDVQMGLTNEAAARVEARLAASPNDESIATPALEFFLSRRLNDASERCLRSEVARQPAAKEPSLALAKFLFSQRRFEDARGVFDNLANQPGDPATHAARWMAIADGYKEQNRADDALACWRQAAAALPDAPAPLLATSEILVARGDAKGAAEQLERALGLTPPGPERVEVERKLFQALQSADSSGASDLPGAGAGWPRVITGGGLGISGSVEITLGKPGTSGRSPGLAARADQPLGRYLAGLQKLVADQPTAAHCLQLARWRLWAGETGEAIAATESAIVLDASNIPARELLVTIATDTHQRDVAQQRLREIIALDPSRETACLRQIAGLKAEANDLDDALAIYEELQKAAPGSVEALSDLALAQQRAERWYDALATWERAYALSGLTPARRADLRRPLLAAYERLDQFPRGAEILQAAVDAQTDLSAREEVFRELSIFCHKHDLGGWLEKEYQNRLAARPNDYFTLTALAGLSKDAGRDREAYRLLERAFYSSPDPAASLRTLAEDAEALGENEEAIIHQRRLAALPGQATAENLEKLAALHDSNLDAEAAARIWDQVVAKFPRDPNSLERGAEFFENAGNAGRARELLQRVIALDANNPRRLFHLAKLDIEAGDTARARDLLEQILARTDPGKPDDPLTPPAALDYTPGAVSGLVAGMSSFRARALGLTAPPAPPESDERQVRLNAVRELARLLSSGGTDAERQSWLERWTAAAAAGQRSEPLAAFFFAGRKTQVMALLSGWLKAHPDDDRLRSTFLASGLYLGDYRPLAQWAWRDAELIRRAERGQWLLGALQQFLNNGGKPGPGMVADLFPPEVRLRETLWEAASAGFAERHWYAQAAELGTRVYGMVPTNRSEYALKIAQWELYMGNVGNARKVLLDAIEADRGDSFEISGNAVFAALRAYDLLLPEGERAAFATGYLQRMRDRGEIAHATLAAVLLHGLERDQRATERDLDDLIAMRMLTTMTSGGTVDARRWSYVLNNGAQLQAWGLDALAAYYWRHALKEVSAFERVDGDATNFQSEIRGRLLGVDVAMAADPQRARERVEEYLRSGPGWDVVSTPAQQLLATSQFPAAQRLYESLCRARPGDAENWRNLFIAQESSGDLAALERTVTGLLVSEAPLPPGMARFDLVNRLATLRQAAGDGAGACRLLERAQLAMPELQPLLIQLAQAEEGAGRWEQAVQAWTAAVPQDGSGNARVSLALAHERLGHLDQAIALLNDILHTASEPMRTTAAVRLAQLYIHANRMQDARDFCTRLLRDGPANAVPDVAEALAQAGQQTFVRELVTGAVRRTHEPQLRYHLQRVLVAQYTTPGADLAVFAREMRRLESFARGDPGLRNSFLLVRSEMARKRGADDWLETELKRDWGGSNGDIASGEKLVAMYVDSRRENGLREVIDAIDHHPDLPEQTLHGVEERLVQSGHGAMALPMLERLRRRFPQNDWYALDQARALWQAGKSDEANGVLEAFDATAIFREDLAGQTGLVYLEWGNRARAREKLEAAARRDAPVVRHPQIYLQLARLDREDHRLPEAHRWMRMAYRNPTCTDLTPIIDEAAAAGTLTGETARRTLPGSDIPLTFARRAQLLAAICARLRAEGKVDEARLWVEAHAEYLAGVPMLVTELRRNLSPSDLSALASLTETVVSQTDPPVPRLERELAAVYVQWAVKETGDPVSQLNHLTRARELEPENFDVAQQLASACLAQKQDDRAAAALADFLGPGALPSERTRAHQLLGESRAPTKSPGEER